MTTTDHTPTEVIQRAVYAALGCTTIDRRSLKKINAAVDQITCFVSGNLADENLIIVPLYEYERMRNALAYIRDTAAADGLENWVEFCEAALTPKQ